MGYIIKISEDFYNDVLNVTTYISKILFNPDAADKLRDKINETIELIAKNPKIYTVLETNQKLIYEYRHAKVGNYYIIYHYDNLNVYISRLIYVKRDFDNLVI